MCTCSSVADYEEKAEIGIFYHMRTQKEQLDSLIFVGDYQLKL